MTALPSKDVLIDIPFHDVDVMEYAWHGHYFKYFEIARCALLKDYDYDYPQMRDSCYAWPVIDVGCRYIKPLTYGMTIRVNTQIVEVENRLKITYVIYDDERGERLSKGFTVQVAIDMKSQEMCFVSPPILLEKLGVS